MGDIKNDDIKNNRGVRVGIVLDQKERKVCNQVNRTFTSDPIFGSGSPFSNQHGSGD